MSLLTRNSTPAERARGCVFAETFENAPSVLKNGGTIVGTPAVNWGYTSTGSSFIRYDTPIPANPYTAFALVLEVGPLVFPVAAVGPIASYNGAGDGWDLMFTTSAVALTFRGAGGGSGVYTHAGAAIDLFDGNRHVLVISNDGGTGAFWVDGIQELSGIIPGLGIQATNPLDIGARNGANIMAAGNTIKSVKIFNAGLTQQDALNYYTNETYNYLNQADVVLQLRAQDHDPTNGRTSDSSGKGNHALLGDGAGTGEPTKTTERGYEFDGVNDYLSGLASPAGDYTVTVAKTVSGVFSITHENDLTTFTPITTSGGFTGTLHYMSIKPILATSIQQYDEEMMIQNRLSSI